MLRSDAMAISLTDNEVRRLRLQAQRLDPQWLKPATPVVQVAREVCGVQAQDSAAAALALRVRSAGLTLADIARARSQGRSLVRAWCMRGTLHLVATEDLGWLLPLFGPILVKGDRRRREQLGLD